MPINAFNENFNYPITGYLHQVSDWSNWSNGANFQLAPLGIFVDGREYSHGSLRMQQFGGSQSVAILGSVDPAAETVLDTSPWVDGEVRYYSVKMMQKTAINANDMYFRILLGISNGAANSNMDVLDFRIQRIADVDTIRYRRNLQAGEALTNLGSSTLNQPFQVVARVTRTGNTLVHECALNPSATEGSVSWTAAGTTSFNPESLDVRHDYFLAQVNTTSIAYFDEIRYGNNFSDVVVASAEDAPETKIVILAGQSNATGQGSIADLPSGKNTFINMGLDQTGNIIEPIRLINTPNNRALDASSFGPEVEIGFQVSAEQTNPVILVKYAIGGSRLANDAAEGGDAPGSWHPDYVGTNYYTNLLTSITNAQNAISYFGHTSVVAAACWMQGESDTKTATPARSTAYKANLQHLISQLRTAVSAPTLPFIIGRIHNSLPVLTFEFAPTVRTAQDEIAAEDSNVYAFSTDSYGLLGDSVHYNSAGILSLGTDYATFLNTILAPIVISVRPSWRNFVDSVTGDFIAIRSAWVKDGALSLSQPLEGGEQVEKGWVGQELYYRKLLPYFDIFIMAGQSNMSGFDKQITNTTLAIRPTDPNDNVNYMLDWQKTSVVGDQRHEVPASPYSAYNDLVSITISDPTTTGIFGPEMSFGESLFTTYGLENFAIVKVAVGSSGLYQHSTQLDWNVSSTGKMYQRLIDKVNQAIALVPSGFQPRIRAFIWNQGERECDPQASESTRANTDAYKSNLLSLVNGIKSTFSAQGAGSMGVVTTTSMQTRTKFTNNTSYNDPVDGSTTIGAAAKVWTNIVKLAQVQMSEEDGGFNSHWVTTEDFLHNIDIHYTPDEYVYLGRRYANVLYSPSDTLEYKRTFVSNEAANIAPSANIGVRDYQWFCWQDSGAALVNTDGASGPAFILARYNSKNNLADSPVVLGGINVSATSDAVERSMVAKCPITDICPNATSVTIPLSKLNKFSFYMGNYTTNTAARLVIRAGGNYYLSDTAFTMTSSVLSQNDFSPNAELKELEFNFSANQWRDFTFVEGDAFNMDPTSYSLISAAINESLLITEIGFFVYSLVAPTAGVHDTTGNIFYRMNNLKLELNR